MSSSCLTTESIECELPKLPLELEREICEWSCDINPSSAMDFLLVAHRFYVWATPLLYRSLQLHQEHNLSQIDSLLNQNPPGLKHVQRLIVWWPKTVPRALTVSRLTHLLPLCPSLRDLRFNIKEVHLPMISDTFQVILTHSLPRLNKLWITGTSTTLSQLDEVLMPRQFDMGTFKALTHVIIDSSSIGSAGSLRYLPSLTHLMLCEVLPGDLGVLKHDVFAVLGARDQDTGALRLRVCALVPFHSSRDENVVGILQDLQEGLDQDPRVVLLDRQYRPRDERLDHWHLMDDMFTEAETVVASRAAQSASKVNITIKT